MMSSNSRTKLLVFLVIVPIVILIALWVATGPVDAYTFEGTVHEDDSVWFDIDVTEPDGAIDIHYSTTDWYDDVAMMIYDPDGDMVSMNYTNDEYLSYRTENLEPGMYGLRVQGWSSSSGGEVVFFGTCTYPIQERQVHHFNATGIDHQNLWFDIVVESPGTHVWLVIAWDWDQVRNLYFELEAPSGSSFDYEEVSSYGSDIITFDASEVGSYSLKVWVNTNIGERSVPVHGISNVSVVFREKEPTLAIISPTYSDGPFRLGDELSITWIWDGDVGDHVTITLDTPDIYSHVTIVEDTPNDGEYNWTIVDLDESSTYYRVLVQPSKGPLEESFNFEILVESFTILTPMEGDTFIRGAEVEITWDSIGDTGDYVEIEYTDGTMRWSGWGYYSGQEYNWWTIKEETANDGSYVWTIPETISPQDDLMVRVVSTDDSDIYGQSGQFELTHGPPVEFSSVWDYEGMISKGDRHYFELDVVDTGKAVTLLIQWNNSDATVYGTMYGERGYQRSEYSYSAHDYRSMVWAPDRPGEYILEVEYYDRYSYFGSNYQGPVHYNISSENHTLRRIEIPEDRGTFAIRPGGIAFLDIDVPEDGDRLMINITWDNASIELWPQLTNPIGHRIWYEDKEGGNLTWCDYVQIAGRYTLIIAHYKEDSNESIEVTIRCNRDVTRSEDTRGAKLKVDETIWYEVEVKDLDGPIIVMVHLDGANSSADVRLYGPKGNVVNYYGAPTVTYVPSVSGTYKLEILLLEADDNETTLNVTSNLDLSPSSEEGDTIRGEYCIAALFGGLAVMIGLVMVQGRKRKKAAPSAEDGPARPSERGEETPELETIEMPVGGSKEDGTSEVKPHEDEVPKGEVPEDGTPEGEEPGDGTPEGDTPEPEPHDGVPVPEGAEEAAPPGLPANCSKCEYRFKAPDAMFCPICGTSREVDEGERADDPEAGESS